MITEKEKLQAQDLLRQLMVLREDLNDVEKTFSRLRNEPLELYIKLDGILDADIKE